MFPFKVTLKESTELLILTTIGYEEVRKEKGQEPKAFVKGSDRLSYLVCPSFKCPLTVLYKLIIVHEPMFLVNRIGGRRTNTFPAVLASKNTPSPSQLSTLPNTFPPSPRFAAYQNANPWPPLSCPETRMENSASQYKCGFAFLAHIAPRRWEGE